MSDPSNQPQQPAQPYQPGYGQPYPGGGYQHPSYPQPPYPQPPYYAGPVRAGVNGLAIASMVLGIVWIYWLGSVLALIFGYVARNQIRRQNQSGDGMAIAGIVLGWVGLGMLLLVIFLGVLGNLTYP
jgi:hypothetical protein